jgi:hypothetical protein
MAGLTNYMDPKVILLLLLHNAVKSFTIRRSDIDSAAVTV